MKTFQITREPKYKGEDSLHGSKQYAPDDFLLLVDGEQIGGTYWGGALETPGKWVSYGPAGYSFSHMTREGAEAAQVRAYATNPCYYDRINADDDREREEARQRRLREYAEEDRRKRLGDDEPGPVIWSLPACHALYAPTGEVDSVSAWLEGNGISDLNGWHGAHLERRASRTALVYESVPAIVQLAQAMGNRHVSRDMTETRAATVTTAPPEIAVLPRPDLCKVFEVHYPGRFPLIDCGLNTVCTGCTQAAHAVTVDRMVEWPCAVVKAATSPVEAVA